MENKKFGLGKEALEKKVYDLIAQIAMNSGFEVNSLSYETNISNDLGFDSVAFIELIVEIENEFNIDMDEDIDIENMVIVGNLIKIIEERSEI